MLFQYDTTPLVWFEFQLFKQFNDQLLHGCFTSLYGKSPQPFEGLNVAESVGDTRSNVEENRQLIIHSFQKRLTSFDEKIALIGMNQAHTNRVLVIREQQDIEKATENDFDALITNIPHLILMIKHADCQPILLFNPKRHIIAAIHAGWRGMAQKIITKTIELLQNEWGADSSELFAAIGPSIGPQEYEFYGWEKELPLFLHKYISCNNMLNLWQASIDELCFCGIPPFQIECTNLSTYTLPTLFYSFRRETVTGRNATCICLQKIFN